MSSKAKKIRCHQLWLRLCEEYDVHCWSATSTLLMYVIQSRSIREVGIFYLTMPFLRETSSWGTQGNPIGFAWVDIRSTKHLSFHIIQLKHLLSCMAHSICLWSYLFHAFVFFKCEGSHMQLDLTMSVAYFPFFTKSSKSGMEQKELSITTQCHFSSKPLNNFITIPYAIPPSPCVPSILISTSRFFP
jgi:hypothetical protein